MRFTFVTLFKNIVSCYFEDSILKNAIKRGLIQIDFINPRDFATNKHKKVDEYAIGGGAGMVMSPQPLFDALDFIKKNSDNAYIIFATPVAKKFNQKDSIRLSQKNHIVFVSGRYEGIDERVIEEYADEVLSIGDFILTGGELASLMMCDSISRAIPGVLGNQESLKNESFENNLLQAPTFSKPQNFRDFYATSEYLKGNHAKIADLKTKLAKYRTKYYRPDLFSGNKG